MVRIAATACRRCGTVAPMRKQLTKRGYCVECSVAVMEQANHDIAAGQGEVTRRRLVRQLARAQRELDDFEARQALTQSRRVVPSGRRYGDGPRRPAA